MTMMYVNGTQEKTDITYRVLSKTKRNKKKLNNILYKTMKQ